MKIKKILMVVIISIFTLGKISNAQPITLSATYKQGIYNISQFSGFTADVKLITSNNVTSLIVIDSRGNEKLFKKFDIVNEPINIGIIENGDIAVVVGTGEIAVNAYK